MNNETKKAEQLIQIYKEDMVKDNLRALIHQLQKTMFIIPAMLPKDVDKEDLQKMALESGGGVVKLPEGTRPVPCILTNKDGSTFFPVYTSQTHIPKEPKFDVLMNMPFKSCYTLALSESLKAEGIALNPFTDNLLLKKELLQAIRTDDEKAAAQGKQMKITPEQFKIMMRQRVEFHDLPFRAYKEGAAFIHQLSDEKEALINEIYKNAYQNPELYPYGENDFAVMSLNISEDLMLVRVDLPPVKAPAQLCYRVYITLNPKSEEIHYFTIENAREKDARNLGGVDSEGKHVEYGAAPVEGAELQRVMDLITETQQTS